MALEITLPFGKKTDAKNLVFTILSHEFPLRLIDITRKIKKSYRIGLTFQAIRKAVLQLVDSGVLIRESDMFQISARWVTEVKQHIDKLHKDLHAKKSGVKETESIGGNLSVFRFDSIHDLLYFWEGLIDDWYNGFEKGDNNINAYLGAHIWEGLFEPNRERKVMGQLHKKGIKGYCVITSDTKLDKNIMNFYSSVGLKCKIRKLKNIDKSYYVGTYGNMIIQTYYPDKLVKALDEFFVNNKDLEKLNLHLLAEIVNMPLSVELTVIRNPEMARQISESIIRHL
jgi:hypothetical protein